MNTFELRALSFTYPNSKKRALEDVNIVIPQGAFFVLCGPSGCGKSTLLRQLKTVLAPHGTKEGEVLFEGVPLSEIALSVQAGKIGFVLQSPENQVVTDKVWHELAFGLESLGVDTPEIRRRVAEMAAFFGIEDWFYKDVAELSGGQKQLLNLASVMVMQPSVLILDEPTSQLDPIAASEFLSLVGKINRELGVTVVLTEHRLEDVLPLATHAAVLDDGRLLCAGTPREVGCELKRKKHAMFLAMPAPMRVWASVESDLEMPLTVREGRTWLEAYAAEQKLLPVPEQPRCPKGDPVLEGAGLWFRYEKALSPVVRGLNLTVAKGEFLAILGGNGAGKTTSLNLLAGHLTPERGSVTRKGTVAILPQDPKTLFVKKTVEEDLRLALPNSLTAEQKQQRFCRIVGLCRLQTLLKQHPYDLSGGEQQRAALAKVLLTQPQILLLDEPTKGFDAEFKRTFAGILDTLLAAGVAVVMVSHDVEFCAQHAHRCALFFDGGIVTEDTARAFFAHNNFYTTAASRMAKTVLPEAVTTEDVIAACGGVLPPAEREETEIYEFSTETPADEGKKKLPLWRRVGALISGVTALVLFLRYVMTSDLSALLAGGDMTRLAGKQFVFYGAFLLCLLLCALLLHRPNPTAAPTAAVHRKLTKRTVAALIVTLTAIPLTLLTGVFWLDVKQYYLTALLIALETMIPFFLVFEGRKPQARELTVIAVLCALAVAGRAALFMLPQFKPVLALTIIAGIAFGGETGFLVGAVSMLVSNMLFSQGPWTPWQMVAAGIIGFLAGVLFRRGLLRCTRGAMCLYGALSAIFIYGGILNPASALMWMPTVDLKILLTYYLTGFPMDCIHGLGTWLFLWFAAEPMLEKLDRIKTKYGILA